MQIADTILLSSAVFTANTLEPMAGGVAVAGDRIIAVGSKDTVMAYAGDETKVMDFGDKLVMPGFNDSHMHFPRGSAFSDEMTCINLLDVKSAQECADAVAEFDKKYPGTGWVFGWGWYQDVFTDPTPPTRQMLDATGVDRPICLTDFSMHIVWVNTKALETVGVDENTPVPMGCELQKDENGQLTGIGNEVPVTDWFGVPALTIADLPGLFKRSMTRLNQIGITAVGDMYPYGISNENIYETYGELEQNDELSLRISFFPSGNDAEAAAEWRAQYHSDKLRCAGVKLILDGIVEERTAFMKEPYLGAPEGDSHCGEPNYTQEELNRLVSAADAAGLPARIHAIGDGSAHMIVRAVEQAEAEHGSKGMRFGIEHTDNLDIEDIKAMHRLGIGAAVQPIHAIGGLPLGIYEDMIGPGRTSHMWRYRDLVDNDVHMGLGTDWPACLSIRPLDTIYAAVTRSDLENTHPEGYYKQNAITLGEALQAHTLGSAYMEGFDNQIGSLATGKFADIVVIDRNLFAIDPHEIHDAQVELTMFNGKVVYQKN